MIPSFVCLFHLSWFSSFLSSFYSHYRTSCFLSLPLSTLLYLYTNDCVHKSDPVCTCSIRREAKQDTGKRHLFSCGHQSWHARTRDPVQYGVAFPVKLISFTPRCTGCRCTGNIRIRATAVTGNALADVTGPELQDLIFDWIASPEKH